MTRNISSVFKILGGLSGLIILLSFILIGELASVLVSGDTGSMLWTTFHFVLNPIACLGYIVFTFVKMRHSGTNKRLLYLLGIAIAIFYVYIAFTGNTVWVEFFNITF